MQQLLKNTVSVGPKWMKLCYCAVLLTFFWTSCEEVKPTPNTGNELDYAKNLSITAASYGHIVEIKNPWPNSTKNYRYLFLKPNHQAPDEAAFDAVIQLPLKRIVLTATHQVAALDLLGKTKQLVGFPQTQFISNANALARVSAGTLKNIGTLQQLDIEQILALQPDVLIGFGITSENADFQQLKALGIPLIFDAGWMEQHPLGRAEWIKFFGIVTQAQAKADSLFETVSEQYQKVIDSLQNVKSQPTILSGALYESVWYLPGGASFMANYFKDAKGHYLWAKNKQQGSLSLSIENVFQRAQDADFWFGPGVFTSAANLKATNTLYGRFKAFNTNKIYTYNKTLGPTGGTLFFEKATFEPHIVLQDIAFWLHPKQFPYYSPYYFKPLDP